jgi:hypothetical protein
LPYFLRAFFYAILFTLRIPISLAA